MKAGWQDPKLEVIAFEAGDILTTSITPSSPDVGDQGTPWI